MVLVRDGLYSNSTKNLTGVKMGKPPVDDDELERRFQSMPLFMDHIPADWEPTSTHMEAIKALLDETDPNGCCCYPAKSWF